MCVCVCALYVVSSIIISHSQKDNASVCNEIVGKVPAYSIWTDSQTTPYCLELMWFREMGFIIIGILYVINLLIDVN